MSCPKLKIPWPRVLSETPPNVDHDQENWKAVERWSDGILKCIPSGCQVYCNTESFNVDMVGGTGTASGTGVTVTISARSTIGVFSSLDFTHTAAHLLTGTVVEDLYAISPASRAAGAGYGSDYYSSSSCNSAITLNPGTYLFAPRATVDDGVTTATVTVQSYLTIVVGDNTEDTCMIAGCV